MARHSESTLAYLCISSKTACSFWTLWKGREGTIRDWNNPGEMCLCATALGSDGVWVISTEAQNLNQCKIVVASWNVDRSIGLKPQLLASVTESLGERKADFIALQETSGYLTPSEIAGYMTPAALQYIRPNARGGGIALLHTPNWHCMEAEV